MATMLIFAVIIATFGAVVSAQQATMTTSSSSRNMMMMSSSTMKPMMGMSTSSPMWTTTMSGDGDDNDADWNAYMANFTAMSGSNATAAVYDDLSDVVQLAMNATTFMFSNRELQSFMSAQDGMDWMWKPSVSARWCTEACTTLNKTSCPTGQLTNPMVRNDPCRTCVLECLACTYEDNYWQTLRSYVMTLMAPVIQLASSTMAVDMSDPNQAQQAQQAQQAMYDKFNVAMMPLMNRMKLDAMYNLNCQMFAGYQGTGSMTVTATNSSSSNMMMMNNNSNSSSTSRGGNMMNMNNNMPSTQQ